MSRCDGTHLSPISTWSVCCDPLQIRLSFLPQNINLTLSKTRDALRSKSPVELRLGLGLGLGLRLELGLGFRVGLSPVVQKQSWRHV